MALEVAAAIIGILAAAGKVAETLGPYVSAWKHAPKNAAAVLSEVNASRVCLSALRRLLDDLDSSPRNRRTLIQIDRLIATFTDGVLLFSELELIILEIDKNRTKWAWKDNELAGLTSRLQCFKSSISVMLNILQCGSDQEAINSGQELLAITSSLLQSNLDLSRRLARLENHLIKDDFIHTSRPVSIATTMFQVQDEPSFESREMKLKVPPSARWFFERDLIASRVYRKARRNTCDVSFYSSIPGSHAWSTLSDISLSDISVISVVALPVDWTEVPNARYQLYGTPISGDLNESVKTAHVKYSLLSKFATVTEYRPSTRIRLVVYETRGAGGAELLSHWAGKSYKSMEYATFLRRKTYNFSKECEIGDHTVSLDIEVVDDLPQIPGNNEYIDRNKLHLFVFSVEWLDSVTRTLRRISDICRKGVKPHSMIVVANHCPDILGPSEQDLTTKCEIRAKIVGYKFYTVSKDNPGTIASAISELVQAKWEFEKKEHERRQKTID